MSTHPDHETELLRRLLAYAEEESGPDHVDLELLALFAQNALPASDRQSVILVTDQRPQLPLGLSLSLRD